MDKQQLETFNILVVDDAQMIRKLVQSVLMGLGFINISMASSGRKALELIAKNSFDFIITDWSMEDIDGIEIVREVRRTETRGHITPIIMLTANTEATYVKTAIKEGVNAYLIKPFSAENMAKKIMSIIDAPREFIVSKTYKGPDRRHHNRPPPDGVEKRRLRKK